MGLEVVFATGWSEGNRNGGGATKGNVEDVVVEARPLLNAFSAARDPDVFAEAGVHKSPGAVHACLEVTFFGALDDLHPSPLLAKQPLEQVRGPNHAAVRDRKPQVRDARLEGHHLAASRKVRTSSGSMPDWRECSMSRAETPPRSAADRGGLNGNRERRKRAARN